ncbi:MAG: MBG domain-containing protein [Tannerella sp.]|nr:MBG domain-containing protein [Tannerella sp.]
MNYLAATDLPLGSYTVTGVPPTPAEFDFHLSDVTYDGSAHPVTVTFKPGSAGFGTVTAVKYNGVTTPPTAAGSYGVTADISAGAGHAAIDNLPLGSFTIAKATPTPTVLDFTLSDIACTGRPYPVPVIPVKDIAGLGEITVYYNGSTTVPVDPGEYLVTVDIAGGANYAAIYGLPLGAFTIQESPIPVPTRFRVLLPSAAGLTTDPPARTASTAVPTSRSR